MKKIGIITIPDYNNYGNRLQNYAVKKFFENKGFQVETLEMNDSLFPKYKARRFKLLIKKIRLIPISFLFEVVHSGISGARRYLKFEMFTQKYLNVRYFPTYDDANYKKICEDYEYIILGSDQIWHPRVNNTPNLFFASFVPIEKRLFFSPSFGVEVLEDNYAQLVKDNLVGVKKISVREDAGKKILQKLTTAEISVLCDPTLCLSKSEWLTLINKPVNIPDNYILSYFLGPLNNQYEKVRDRIQKELKCDIYSIADKGDRKSYETGPCEFIYSILHSRFIITDSFHAVAFSVVFSKPFLVCSRLLEDGTYAGLDSRIDVFLKRFGLENRKLKPGVDIETILSAEYDCMDMLRQLKADVEYYFSNIKKEDYR